ncbi:MAG: transposase [Bacteroidota bacterium]|jgi:REP element-mobilizing transposase RayT|nr:transposase [Bacteroidota bacterium]
MIRKLRYCRRCVAHIYLRAVSGFVVFYSVKDILVFFTLLNVLSETYGIRICVVSIMLNHFHLLIEAENHNAIAKFMKELSRRFTAEFNGRISRKGRLFEGPFGLSVKAEDKKVRTAISYLYNNPVENKHCRKAEMAQWNFLAYSVSDHPFSEKLVLRNASGRLKRGVREIRWMRSLKKPLNYAALDRISEGLDTREIKQLTDFIVNEYSRIDHERAVRFYASRDEMIRATDSNAGNEHDILEEKPSDDRPYFRMLKKLSMDPRFRSPKDVLRLSEKDRWQIAEEFLQRGMGPKWQILRLLHLKLPTLVRRARHRGSLPRRP